MNKLQVACYQCEQLRNYDTPRASGTLILLWEWLSLIRVLLIHSTNTYGALLCAKHQAGY